MSRPLVAIERFFERLFERPATRLFHTRLQPVQVQRRLERAMDAERKVSAERTYVRDRYRVLLNAADYADFEGYRGTLEADLAEGLLLRARQRGYTVLARPRVRLESSDGVGAGEIEVIAEMLDPEILSEISAGLRRVDGGPSGGARRTQQTERAQPRTSGEPAMTADASGPGTFSLGGSAAVPSAQTVTPAAPSSSAGPTIVYPIPRVNAPSAIIEIAGPGMPPHRVAYRGGTLRVGRAPDGDIVLHDERVSRRHGSITSRQGALIYTDQGSTNGSFVNGSRVTEIALGTGDVVRLGNTTLTIHPDR